MHTLCFISFIWLAHRDGLLAQQTPSQPEKLYWVEYITPDGNAIVRTYESTATQSVKVPDVELWPQKVNVRDPMSELYWEEPDLTYEILRKGYGQLKNASEASLRHQEAQLDAAAVGRGLWDLKDGTSKAPAEHKEGLLPANFLSPEKAVYWISVWGGVSAVLGSIALLARSLVGWWRRKRLPLVFLGAHSVGKSWLWARIKDPDITLDQLEAIDRTDVTNRTSALQPKTMGKYVVTPTYIDTPGGQPGWQVTEMLGRRWLKPRKTVWVILLSTTPLKSTTRESPEDQKIDSDYMAEQLGYLMLPLGILSSPRAPKPNMIIMVISKFDLFAEKDDFVPAKQKLRELFRRHIERVEGECSRADVEFKLEFCSAREGWRALNIHSHIEKAIFSR